MTDGRGWRLAPRGAFLGAPRVGPGGAGVEPLVVVGTMLAGWVLVALLEWASWREEPHWSSGSPPSYYVPPSEVPPRRAVDLRYAQGYPAQQREVESPTWIATPEMRRAVLGEWPVPVPAADGEELVEDGDPAVAVPVAAPEPERVPEPVAVAEPTPAPVLVVDEADAEPVEDALVHEVAAVPTLEDAPVTADEPPPDREADTNGIDPWEVQAFPREPAAVRARPSRHRIDPLGEPEARRWRRRSGGATDGGATAEFPTRPRHPALPRRGGDA